jgi:hypothetical protein
LGYQCRMDDFDFRASSSASLSAAPPPGYGVGRVRIGRSDETIFFSTAVWSPSDYARHWKATAQLLLQGETGVFCTDLNETNASIFIGFPNGSAFEFEQWVVPRHEVELDGLRLTIAVHARHDGASCWHVSADAVKAFSSS